MQRSLLRRARRRSKLAWWANLAKALKDGFCGQRRRAPGEMPIHGAVRQRQGNKSVTDSDAGESHWICWVVASFVLVAAFDWADYLAGPDIAFTLFHLIPVGLLAWFTTRWLAVMCAVLSAVTWLIGELGRYDVSIFHYYWETVTRLGIFLVTAILLSKLRETLKREQRYSRTDAVTGVGNRRAFNEACEIETYRARRKQSPLTVVYIDLDNFKDVNDRLGHAAGDAVLDRVAQNLLSHLRRTDVIARLGGDEFAVLLPETDGAGAKVVTERMQRQLGDEMAKGNWPVTFSIGAFTCTTPPRSATDLVKRADQLMYAAKQSGKNTVRHLVDAPPTVAGQSNEDSDSSPRPDRRHTAAGAPQARQ